jgi:uncharacterized protein
MKLVDSLYREQLLWTLKGVGTNRILFGSDYPIYSPKEAIESIKRLGFNKLELEQICLFNVFRHLDFTVNFKLKKSQQMYFQFG